MAFWTVLLGPNSPSFNEKEENSVSSENLSTFYPIDGSSCLKLNALVGKMGKTLFIKGRCA